MSHSLKRLSIFHSTLSPGWISMGTAKLLNVMMYVRALTITSGEMIAQSSFFKTKRVGSVTDFTERPPNINEVRWHPRTQSTGSF